MITIRLSRTGVRKRPFYHIVVADRRRARDGRYLERLGYYNPVAEAHEAILTVNRERFDYWKGKGAEISHRVAYLTKPTTLEKLQQKAKKAGDRLQMLIDRETKLSKKADTAEAPEEKKSVTESVADDNPVAIATDGPKEKKKPKKATKKSDSPASESSE